MSEQEMQFADPDWQPRQSGAAQTVSPPGGEGASTFPPAQYEQPAMRIWTPEPVQTSPWTIPSTDSISGTGQVQQMQQKQPPAPARHKSQRRLLGLLSRIALVVIWFTTPLVNRAFHGGWIVPLLGVIFLPLTALTYTVVSALAGSVTGLGWLWVAGALLLDLARYAGRTNKRKSGLPQDV